jgi:hypothetical protein
MLISALAAKIPSDVQAAERPDQPQLSRASLLSQLRSECMVRVNIQHVNARFIALESFNAIERGTFGT